jgi:hypothetical protein
MGGVYFGRLGFGFRAIGRVMDGSLSFLRVVVGQPMSSGRGQVVDYL